MTIRGAGSGSGSGSGAGDAHEELRSLLGAWALDACPPEETARLEAHLASCRTCAAEARRLRDAAGWLSADDPLDPAPGLRNRVLDGCLGLRDPAVRVPDWAGPYAAETARLDALLKDLDPAEWQERAEARWQGGSLVLRPAQLLCHLAAVDGCAARTLGLPDPLDADGEGPGAPTRGADGPIGGDLLMERTERLIHGWRDRSPEGVRALWREQTRALVAAASRAEAADRSGGVDRAGPPLVDYGRFQLPLPDAFLDRAFECWVHGEDIAHAVDYPYPPPSSGHLHRLVDLAARLLPAVLPAWLGPIRLVLEGAGAGAWTVGAEKEHDPDEPVVASIVLDSLEFCYLAAGRRNPDRVPCGVRGDRDATHALLTAVPRLSRP
jgi:uncharacterized protein (TIGR03083 family)